MKKRSERANKACRQLLLDDECIEEIIEVQEAPDFVQIHGKIGGDYVIFRVYDDGKVYEK
jgi:hypothetical protein